MDIKMIILVTSIEFPSKDVRCLMDKDFSLPIRSVDKSVSKEIDVFTEDLFGHVKNWLVIEQGKIVEYEGVLHIPFTCMIPGIIDVKLKDYQWVTLNEAFPKVNVRDLHIMTQRFN